MRCFILLLLFAVLRVAQAAPPVKYEQPLYLALAVCLDSLPETESPEQDDLLDIPAECPELAEAMAASPLIRHAELGADTPVKMTSLWSLYDLLANANNLELSNHRLRHDDLAAVLDAAYMQKPEAKKTLWQIFMEWLRSKLEGDVDTSYLKEIVDWLSKYLPLETIAEYLTYGAILILVLLVLGVVVYQLYEARVIPQLDAGRWLKRSRRRGEDKGFEQDIDLHTLKSLPLHRQPGAILSWCVNELLKRGVLTNVRDRTNRELLEYLRRTLAAPVSARFQSIVEAAEQSVYGNVTPGAEQIAGLYDRAESIFSAQSNLAASERY